MDSVIHGRELAQAKARLDSEGKKLVFKPNSKHMKVSDLTLEMYAVDPESLQDCIKQLEDMGLEKLKKEHGYQTEDGEKHSGAAIVSQTDPRILMSVDFGSKYHNDSSYFWLNPQKAECTLTWFLRDMLGKEISTGAAPEAPVSSDEMDILNKLRVKEEPKQESFQRVKDLLTTGSYEPVVEDFDIEPDTGKGEKMRFHEDMDSVDLFGLPLTEDVKKQDEVEKKHVGVDSLAKPAAKEEGDKERGEKKADEKLVKVGDPGEKDGKGEVVKGDGSAEDQDKKVPASASKVGKPGDDHGKLMAEVADLSKRFSVLEAAISKLVESAAPKKNLLAKHARKMGEAKAKMQEMKAKMGMKKAMEAKDAPKKMEAAPAKAKGVLSPEMKAKIKERIAKLAK